MTIYAEVLYCYEANLVNAPFRCYAKSSSCQILTDMIFAVYRTTLPLLFMLIFGLMTISNIQQSQRRVLPTITKPISQRLPSVNEYQQRTKKTERHLLFMIFTQFIVLAVLTLPQATERLYAAFIGTFDSKLHATIDMFIYNTKSLSINYMFIMPLT